MKKFYALTILVILFSGCRTLGPNAAGGGAFGSLAGGLAGAAIGATEGKAPEGALIGAVTGATVGTLAGNAVDQEIQQQRFADQQFRNQQVANSISMEQVIRMTQSGLGSDIIARQVSTQGVAQRPTIDDLIDLKRNGVDDRVIQALQTAPVAGQLPATRVIEPRLEPVIVEPYPIYTAPTFLPPRRLVRPRPVRPRCVRPIKPGVEVSFGF